MKVNVNMNPSNIKINAIDIPIADAGNLITATTAEGAIQENRQKINAHVAGTADNHSTSAITNDSGVAGTTSKDALNQLQSQINGITVSGSVDPQVGQALVDNENVTHTTLKNRLDSHLTRTKKLEEDTQADKYSTPVEETAGIISLSSTSAEGQLRLSVLGRSLKQELNYNRDTWAEWTKSSSGVTGDSTGIEFTLDGITSKSITLNTNFKPSTKYGILQNIVSNNISTESFYVILGNAISDVFVRTGDIGNKKTILTTPVSITTNKINIGANFGNRDAGSKVRLRDIRVFELPTGSEIEADFTNLTADQLAQKYPYIKGDSVKSTLSTRVRSVGKNLFDGELELGGFVNAAGVLYTANDRMRNKNKFIRIEPNAKYVTDYGGIDCFWYDNNKNFISRISATKSIAITAPTNAYYLNFVFFSVDLNAQTQIERGTQATPYEPYQSTESYYSTPDGQPLRSVGSVKDEIRDSILVDGKLVPLGYIEKIQKVSNDETFNSIISTTTGTNVDLQKITSNNYYTITGKSDPNLVSALNLRSNGKRYTIITSGWDNVMNIGMAYISTAGIYIIVSKGENVIDFPIVLNYQLANPITTRLDDIAQLIAYPSGQIYVDLAVKEVVISNGDSIQISNTSLPIKELETVILRNTITGDITELKVSECTIATDKLSFSHPSISSDLEVTFAYKYDEALSTLPTVKYSYPMNTSAMLKDTFDMASKNNKDMVEMHERVSTLEYELIKEDYTEQLTNDNGIFSVGTGNDASGVQKDYNKSVAEGQLRASVLGNTRRNILTDNQASVETDTTGFGITGTTTLTRETTEKLFGSASLKVVTQGSVSTEGFYTASANALASKTYIGSVYIKGSGTIKISLDERDSSDVRIGSLVYSAPITLTNNWQRISISKIFSATASKARLYIVTEGAQAITFYADGIMIEESATLNDFITGTKSTLPARVRSTGKNLFDKNHIGNLKGQVINSLGNFILDANFNVSHYIKINPNTAYAKPQAYRVLAFDSNKVSLGLVPASTTFTTPANATYIRCVYGANEGDTFQVEKGTTPTQYEPYQQNESFIQTPDGQPLRSVGSVKDEIRDSILVDGKLVSLGYVEKVQRVNPKILQASDVTLRATGTNAESYQILISDGVTTNNSDTFILEGYKNGLNNPATYDDVSNIGCAYTSTSDKQIRIIFAKGTTLAQAQTALASKALSYQLATPIVTQLDVNPLYAHNKGMFILEPYIAQSFKHNGTSITLPCAVSGIDEIVDLDGTPVTSYTLSTDGKTLTFTGVLNAYYHVKAPIRPEESTIPTIVHYAPLNRVADKKDLQRIDKVNQDQQFQLDQLALQVAQMMGV